MAADLTSPGLLDPNGTAPFPPVSATATGAASNGSTVVGPEVPEARLPRDVACQVLDIENLTRSRWDQVEELEAVARGELTRGRQVVRVRDVEGEAGEAGEGDDVPPEDRPGDVRGPGQGGAAAQPATTSDRNATHRLVLQDCKGQKLFGLELRRVERLGVGRTNIGEKILLRAGTVVARGTVLLEPDRCVVLGGKVEAWQKSWLDGRLARLKEAAGNPPDKKSR